MVPFLLVACTSGSDVQRHPLQVAAGAPLAGVAEGDLDIPVGAPMGGYTNRCSYLGSEGTADRRDSAYAMGFSPSAGEQTRLRTQALWLDNGSSDLVLIRADAVYSDDALVDALEAQLTEATGRSMIGRVVVATSHSHASHANFSDQVGFYLGGDRYNPEVFARTVASMMAVALEAHDARQPARLGLGIAKDWDPEHVVVHDRRPENDKLQMFDDIAPGPFYDPYLYVLRVDDLAGTPLGVFFTFGMHGTALSSSSAMVSSESTGSVEAAVEDRFPANVVVAHLQGSGGDQSPGGKDLQVDLAGTAVDTVDYALLESIGLLAVDPIMDLWQSTPTSSDPIVLDSFSYPVPIGRDDIHLTRNGQIDLEYAPYDETRIPDNQIYGEDGRILNPIDEFNNPYGAAFCGSGDPLIPSGGIGATVYPYNTCMDWQLVSRVVLGIFDLEESDVPMPTPHTVRALATAARIGPLAIRDPDGSTTTDDVLMAFFPGEPVATYGELARRQAAERLGFEHTMVVGYSQDHEGYLLPPEDWLLGGYEPNISLWGPLAAEQIMQTLYDQAELRFNNDVVEPWDAAAGGDRTPYADRPLPTELPDETPLAGTPLDEAPEYLFTPLLSWMPVEITPPTTVERVKGIVQFAWQGGDPAVDHPHITLQRLDGATWTDVTEEGGRTVNDGRTDIIVTWTPDPLLPSSAAQTHQWWAAWQAVGPTDARAGLPTGTYRLHIEGSAYTGGGTTWPWPSEDYVLDTPSFDVEPTTIALTYDGATLTASMDAPAAGWRVIDIDGSSVGPNPTGELTATWTLNDATTSTQTLEGTNVNGRTQFAVEAPANAVHLDVADPFANRGSLDL